MAKIRTNVILDPDFKKFLDYMKDTTGASISWIIETATKEKYQAEYERFRKQEGNAPEKE